MDDRHVRLETVEHDTDMRTLAISSLRPLAAALTLALFPSQDVTAQTLYVGGLDTFFMQGDPSAGNFQFLGACGGSIQSMIESHDDLYLGDVGGRVYQFFGQSNHPFFGATTYVFDSPNDATALVDYGGTVLVGGTDGTVHMIDKNDGSVERTFNATVPVGAMLRIGGSLFVGSSTLDVMEIDLDSGATSLLGTCGGQIHSMVRDEDHLVLGTPSGVIYRMALSTGFIDGAFAVANEATALLMHGDDLLVGGSSNTILRLDPELGTSLGTLTTLGNDVSALAMSPAIPEPGWPYCYGLNCPCGNDDPLSGCENSSGAGARMFGQGTASVTADDMVLTADQLPPNVFAVNYMGILANDITFGDGKLCTGAGYPVFRYNVQHSGSAGVITLGPGLAAHSHANFPVLGQINPGSTFLWQIWYRNPTGPCGSGFNTSNGYMVHFTP